MTRKSRFILTNQPKKKIGLVIDVTDDENFNWLHSRRTPEEKKRDEEISMRFKERIKQLELEEKLRRESNDLSKSSQAPACNEERSNRVGR